MGTFAKEVEARAQKLLAEQPRGLNGDLEQFSRDFNEEIKNHAKLTGRDMLQSIFAITARRLAQGWQAHNALSCLVWALIDALEGEDISAKGQGVDWNEVFRNVGGSDGTEK